MSDQDIDNLFQEGLSDARMPFDESAWASAEQAIIAHEAAKRRRGIIIWFISGLLLLSSILGIYQYTGDENSLESIQNNKIQKTLAQIPESSQSKNSPKESENNDAEERDEKTNNSSSQMAPSGTGKFKSDYSTPNYGRTEKLPPLIALDEEPNTRNDFENRDPLAETKAVPENRFLADLMALRYADIQNTDLAEAYRESAGEAADINLPYHWNTKINLITGLMPLDYTSNEESGTSRLPYYAGIGISKIHNYSWEYGAAILIEELIYSDNEKTIEQTEYGFGKTTHTYRIRRNRGNYASLPLYLKYRLKNNHAFMAGVQYSRLLQSYSSYITESENDYLNTTSIDEQNNISGFRNDLTQNQLSLILGYDLTLSDRLRLQVLGRLGANSLYQNEIFENSFSDRVHLRIGIEYSLWRF